MTSSNRAESRDSTSSMLIQELHTRALENGGFEERIGGGYRPDSTAWAILAIERNGAGSDITARARDSLLSVQLEDGRVALSLEHREVFWPTSLAILAWQGSKSHESAQKKAVRFLLKSFGKILPKADDAPYKHDNTIPGWPWTADTASFVEPTALALLSLHSSGHGDSARATEAVTLLLDRQLEAGGWNYGNKMVFGQDLRPMITPTGAALQALAGLVNRSAVARSLDYLESLSPTLRSPLSLGWAILGLSAWGRRPANVERLAAASMEKKVLAGGYGTTELSLLFVALASPSGMHFTKWATR